MANTFSREEKLKSKTLIDHLFSKGKRLFAHPLLLFWDTVPANSEKRNAMVLCSVPKKTARKAVERNRLKRQMRECYRLNKYFVPSHTGDEQLVLAFVLISSDNISYDLMNRKLIILLRQLQEAITAQKT